MKNRTVGLELNADAFYLLKKIHFQTKNMIKKKYLKNYQGIASNCRNMLWHAVKLVSKVSKGAKIRNRCNQVPTQDINGKVTNSQLDTTIESQEVNPFPAGDHKAHLNRRTQRHSKHKTEKKHKIHKRSTALECLGKYFTGGLKLV